MNTIVAIIPLYNGADYIETAIRSVLDQRRPADEIIVVNDGSSDHGPALVEAMAAKNPKIRLLYKDNGGQGSARNYGVKHSGCDLIALLDQDDYWYDNHLEALERPFIESDTNLLAYTYSNLDRIDREGTMIHHGYLDYFKTEEHPKRTLVGCLKEHMYILPSASLISKVAFDAVGGFDERLIGYEDDELFIKIFCAGFKSVYVNRSLSAWRIHSGSASASMRMVASSQLYYDRLVAEFENKKETRRDLIKDVIAPRFAILGYQAVRDAVRRNDAEGVRLSLPFVLKCAGRMRPVGRARILFRLSNRLSKYLVLFYFKKFFRKESQTP
jgi:glycosyltransferase involved in cell wall biosynthesis